MCAPRTETGSTYCVWKGCTKFECIFRVLCALVCERERERCVRFDDNDDYYDAHQEHHIPKTEIQKGNFLRCVFRSDSKMEYDVFVCVCCVYLKYVGVAGRRKGWRARERVPGWAREWEKTKAHLMVRQLVCANTTVFYLFFSRFVRNTRAPHRNSFAISPCLQTYVRKFSYRFEPKLP